MTNVEAWFSNSLRPRKPEGSLGRTAQDGHLDSHTAPALCDQEYRHGPIYTGPCTGVGLRSSGAIRKSRWPSWAFRPNEPYGFRGRKAVLNHAHALAMSCVVCMTC